jgi:RNA polymerase sigma-70 factor (ECF subfamily)
MVSDVEATDLDLIRRAKDGEERAFDVLIRRYGPRTHQLIYGLVRNPADADDLMQETFLRAYENIRSFKEEFRFYTWLHRIAVNLCFTFLKRRKLAPVNLADLPGDSRDDDKDPDLPDERGATLNEQVDQRRNVEKALARLPVDQRTAVILRTYDDLSYAQIAEVMDTSIGTVMSRLARGREKLRELLAEYRQGKR